MLTYSQAIRALKLKAGEDVEDTALLGRLMAYCSKVLGMMMMMVMVMAFCSNVLGMTMVTFGMLLRHTSYLSRAPRVYSCKFLQI